MLELFWEHPVWGCQRLPDILLTLASFHVEGESNHPILPQGCLALANQMKTGSHPSIFYNLTLQGIFIKDEPPIITNWWLGDPHINTVFYHGHSQASMEFADGPMSILWLIPSQAPIPLTLFRSNSKFNQNLESSGLRHSQPVTTKFCTHHNGFEVLHIPQQLHCCDICKISLWLAEYVMNKSIWYFIWLNIARVHINCITLLAARANCQDKSLVNSYYRVNFKSSISCIIIHI